MSIKRIFIAISAIFAASAVFADNSSVTSKKYVDDLMSGYQGKLPGSGANTLMIYDNSEDGIGEKSIAATLGNSASAVSVPTVGAVKTGLDGKQDTITGTAGYVMTGTGNPGEVGEKPIYSSTIRDEDSLVTAESVNSGVINAVNHSLRRVNANGELDNNGTLWEIADTVVAFSYLPAGYTQLEYIESTGTQYIDTGYHTTSETWVHIKFMGLASGNKNWFGGTANKTSTMSFVLNQYDTASAGSSFEYLYGGPSSTWPTFSQDNIIGTLFEIDFAKNKKIYLNGIEKVTLTNTKTTDTDGTLWLFGRYNGSAFITGRVYEFSIYENNVKTMNFIPASFVENGQTVVGMYDTVSGQFFRDGAGGNFIAGPAVVGN